MMKVPKTSTTWGEVAARSSTRSARPKAPSTWPSTPPTMTRMATAPIAVDIARRNGRTRMSETPSHQATMQTPIVASAGNASSSHEHPARRHREAR